MQLIWTKLFDYFLNPKFFNSFLELIDEQVDKLPSLAKTAVQPIVKQIKKSMLSGEPLAEITINEALEEM